MALQLSPCHCAGSHGCSCGGVDTQCQVMERLAVEERAEMQLLNDRLASYVSRVRQMRSQATTTPSGYHESMQALEEEILSVKELYEAELIRLRSLLEESSKHAVAVVSQLEQVNISSQHYQARYEEEAQRVRTLTEELQCVHMSLSQERKELAEVRLSLMGRDNQLRTLQPTHQRLQQENEELKRRLEIEMNRGLQAVEEMKMSQERISFDGHTRTQYIHDLEERLRASHGIVVSLESRINQLTQTDTFDTNALLKKLRDGSAAELRRYQQETETALQRSLQALRCQMEEEVRAKAVLGQEKDDLDTRVVQLQAVIAELQAKVTTTEQLRLAAEAALTAEKKRCQTVTVTLERRIRELQECIMTKVKECTGARDAQMSLKMEIDAFKSLMEAEEKQLTQVSTANVGQSVVKSTDMTRCPPILRRRPLTPTYNVNNYSPNYQISAYGNMATSYKDTYRKWELPSNRASVNFAQYQPGATPRNYSSRRTNPVLPPGSTPAAGRMDHKQIKACSVW